MLESVFRPSLKLLSVFAAGAIFGFPCLPQNSSENARVKDAVRIHQGDLVEIDEIGGFDFDWRGKLNPEGFLDGFTKIPEQIFARCRTTDEVADAVSKEYAKVLRNPIVRVRILDRSDRALGYITGAVKQPQRLRIKRDVYLSELIVVGGGFTDRAGGEITIFRPENLSCESDELDASRTLRIKISDILAGKTEANPKIVSGDLVTVLLVQPVYVIGGVVNPGKTSWRDGLSISRAVAAAGGLAKGGVTGTASIYRRDGASSKVIEVDLNKVNAGQAEDVAVMPFDIVDVPLKGSVKRRLPPVIEDPDRVPLPFQSMPLTVIE